MSDIFRALGLRTSWPLRGVCRRWRRVVEETEWANFELKGAAASGEHAQSGESAYEAAAAMIEKRKLRLGGGASVTLRPEIVEVADTEGDSRRSWEAGELANRRTLEAARRLLAAIARSHSGSSGGPAQLREVTVEVCGNASESRDYSRQVDKDFVRAYLLGVLEALRPPEGAASGLEGLSVGLTVADRGRSGRFLAWPDAAELRAALAPFGALRSLTLSFEHSHGCCPKAAAAIAAACPLLRALLVSPSFRAAGGVLAALSRLAHLQRLTVVDERMSTRDGVSEGVAALAEGPAGASLAAVAFVRGEWPAVPYRRGEFPRLSPEARYCFVGLSDEAWGALGRMPRLESFRSLRFGGESAAAAALAFGRLASLREARLIVSFCSATSDPDRTRATLRALADAIYSAPRLERLQLRLLSVPTHNQAASPRGPAGEDVASLLGGAGVQRALAHLFLSLDRPLSGAEAAAIAALPALEDLRLCADIRPPAPVDLRPYEVLRDGLRPEVAVRVNLGLGPDNPFALSRRHDPGAEAAARSMFAGRPASQFSW
eukprot:tig00020553_g10552.t1